MSDWKIKRQVLRAASFAMVLFGLLAVYIIYLSTWEADDLAKNPLNMRRAAARADIQRGSILAADGQILAETPEIMDQWDPEVGDRETKLCIIGRHMDKDAVAAKLDELLTTWKRA